MSHADRSPSWEEENVPAAASPASTILSLQIGVIIVAALYFAREVLVPITVAVLLSFVLSPLVKFLRRLRLGRIPSVLIAVLLAIGIIAVIGTIIGSQVAQLTRHAPEYASTIEKKVLTVRELALDKISGVVEHFGYDVKSGQTSTTPPSTPRADSPPSRAASARCPAIKSVSAAGKISVAGPVTIRHIRDHCGRRHFCAAAEGGFARSYDPIVRLHGFASDDRGDG